MKAIKASIVDRLIKKVSRRASEKGRLEGLLCIRDLQHIAHAPDCLDQLCPVIVVYFSAESLYGDINRVSVAVKIHVPDLRGNQGAGKNLSLMANEKFQQAELFTGEYNAVSGSTDFSGYEIRGGGR